MPLTFKDAALKIGLPTAKFLLKHFLGDAPASIGGSLIEIATAKIEDEEQQRIAARLFEDIGDQVVKKLLPLFANVPDQSSQLVALELGITLSANVTPDFLVNRDIDPKKLSTALRALRHPSQFRFSSDEAALYDRALEEAVRYIVGVSPILPRFEAQAVAATLARLSRIRDDIEKTLERICHIERMITRSGENQSTTEIHRRYEADYRQAVARNLDYLELFGADISPEAQRHSLSVGYVSLNVSKINKENSPENYSASDINRLLSEIGGRLLLRGHAGSGKSTLLRWIAIASALGSFGSLSLFATPGSAMWKYMRRVHLSRFPIRQKLVIDSGHFAKIVEDTVVVFEPKSLSTLEALESTRPAKITKNLEFKTGTEIASEPKRWNFIFHASDFPSVGKIPFFVRLRDCRGGRLPKPDELPELIASELGKPPPQWVRTVLDEGRGLLLLDGVDEIPNIQREQVRQAIEAIIRRYPSSQYVVSTRPTAVPENWLAGEKFVEASINPMSEADRTEFITRWHKAVAAELARQGRSADLSSLAAELVAKIADSPGIARLATNPLLCAVICALHKDRHRKLPDSQSELCEAMCHLLLHRREIEAGLPVGEFPAVYRRLTYEQKRAIVQEVAHHMVRNDDSIIEQSDAVAAARKVLKNFPDMNESDAELLLRMLIERSGVLREQRPGYIDFVHNTLKEYLAAELFVATRDISRLARRSVDDTWRPVVLFASATRDRAFGTRLVRKILALAEDAGKARKPDAARRLQLAAVNCRYAALHLEPELVSEISLVERNLVPPRSMADAEALAACGDNVVPLLRYKRMRAKETAACVRTLRLVGTSLAKTKLQDYVKDTRALVVSELGQAVNPLLLKAVKDRLAGGNEVPFGLARNITDISPIGQLQNIEKLDLSSVPAKGLEPLRHLTKLKSLIWRNCHAMDYSPLSSLTEIEQLDLRDSAISDLTAIAALRALADLNCSGAPVVDLAPLAKLRRLRKLNIAATKVNDVGSLSRLSELIDLDVSGLRDLDWRSVSDLRALKKLNAVNAAKIDAATLVSLGQLQSLSLLNTRVENAQYFAELKSLRSLMFHYSDITDIRYLSALLNIEFLLLSKCQIKDFSPIASLPKLRELRVDGSPLHTLESLGKHSQLAILDISETQISDLSGISSLMPNVVELDIIGLSVRSYAPLLNLKELKAIHVGSLTLRDAEAIAQIPQLEAVCVRQEPANEVTQALEGKKVALFILPVLR